MLSVILWNEPPLIGNKRGKIYVIMMLISVLTSKTTASVRKPNMTHVYAFLTCNHVAV